MLVSKVCLKINPKDTCIVHRVQFVLLKLRDHDTITLLCPARSLSRISKHIYVIFLIAYLSLSCVLPEQLEIKKHRQHSEAMFPFNQFPFYFLLSLPTPSPSLEVYFLLPSLPEFSCTATLYFPPLMPDSTRSNKHIYTRVSSSHPQEEQWCSLRAKC